MSLFDWPVRRPVRVWLLCVVGLIAAVCVMIGAGLALSAKARSVVSGHGATAAAPWPMSTPAAVAARGDTIGAAPRPHAALAAAAPVAPAVAIVAAGSGGAASWIGSATPALTGWTLRSGATVPSAHAGQGVATITTAAGAVVVITRGSADIPRAVARAGWVHVGDPDARGGYLVDAYQSRAQSAVTTAAHTAAKMFLVTTPGGRQVMLLHPLVPGELANNSFAAVSPDAQWLVSGEWGTITRLLLFRLPALTPTMQPATLPLAGTVALTHPMRNVQGCSFSTGNALVCSTNDNGQDLYPVARQLLGVQLAHPLTPGVTPATPSLLAPVPQQSACPGVGETEGLDITAGTLRLVVIEPRACRALTRLYTYAAAGA